MSTNGSRVSFRADDQVLELVGVDGCTALRPHENLLNCTLWKGDFYMSDISQQSCHYKIHKVMVSTKKKKKLWFRPVSKIMFLLWQVVLRRHYIHEWETLSLRLRMLKEYEHIHRKSWKVGSEWVCQSSQRPFTSLQTFCRINKSQGQNPNLYPGISFTHSSLCFWIYYYKQHKVNFVLRTFSHQCWFSNKIKFDSVSYNYFEFYRNVLLNFHFYNPSTQHLNMGHLLYARRYSWHWVQCFTFISFFLNVFRR